MSRRNLSDVHEHFHPKQPGHGVFRFCKYCTAGNEIPANISSYRNPGREIAGCVQSISGATSSLLKHARTHGYCKANAPNSKDQANGDDAHTEEVTKDWVYNYVLTYMSSEAFN